MPESQHEALGSAYTDLGQLRDAEDHESCAVDIYRRQGYSAGLTSALSQLGLTYLAEHRVAEAAEAFQRALEMANASGELVQQADASAGLGMVEAARGQTVHALQLLVPAHNLYSRAGVKMKITQNIDQLIARLRREGSNPIGESHPRKPAPRP